MSERADLLVAAQHPGVNMSDYVHKVYFIPKEVAGCNWGGRAAINTCRKPDDSTRCKAWIRQNSAQILAHELGHNIGVHHATDDFDDDGTLGTEYGDYTDVMGRTVWASMNGEASYFFSLPAQPGACISMAYHTAPHRRLCEQCVDSADPDRASV